MEARRQEGGGADVLLVSGPGISVAIDSSGPSGVLSGMQSASEEKGCLSCGPWADKDDALMSCDSAAFQNFDSMRLSTTGDADVIEKEHRLHERSSAPEFTWRRDDVDCSDRCTLRSEPRTCVCDSSGDDRHALGNGKVSDQAVVSLSCDDRQNEHLGSHSPTGTGSGTDADEHTCFKGGCNPQPAQSANFGTVSSVNNNKSHCFG
jgi:hypothetical protein